MSDTVPDHQGSREPAGDRRPDVGAAHADQESEQKLGTTRRNLWVAGGQQRSPPVDEKTVHRL
ncbi:hypothetical protein, partial [Streptomyces sp. NPDC051657]|uniref:hypothetical protein n=1 Tax=Streptomyces sp. NPDC051657 TaxID=3154749 RepID=UPI003441C013